jgi:hypothetical protein
MRKIKIFLIAGEVSGDKLGASLIRSLRSQYKGDIIFQAVGGDKMAAEGVDSIFPMLDEWGYVANDFFIFSSSWDAQYYFETLSPAQVPQNLINQPTINSTTAAQFGSTVNPINQNYNL